MNRLKILLFALVTLGVLGYLLVVSPAAATRSVELAAGAVSGAGPAVGLKLEAQRSALQASMLKLAGSPSMWNAGPRTTGARPEAPSAERFNAIRAAAAEPFAEADRAALWVIVTNDTGTLLAQGAQEPVTQPPEGFELSSVTAAGSAGALASPGGVLCLFYGSPLLISDKNEVRTAGQVLLGLPVLPEARQLEGVARELKLSTLAIVSQGKVVIAAGTEKVQADGAVKLLKAGQVAALVSGPVHELGPLALPLFVTNPAHSVGSRQVIAGTPFEVLAVSSTREPLDALAAYQSLLIFALGGLLLLSIAVTVLVKNGDHDEGGGMVAPPPMPLPPNPLKREPTHEMPVQPHGPEASPEDFQFPEAPISSPSSFAISSPSMLSSSPPPPPAATGQAPALSVGTGQSPAPALKGTGANLAYEPESDPFENAAPQAQPQPPPAPAAPPAPAFPSTRPPSNPAAQAVSRPSSPKPGPPIANPFDDDESGRTVAYPIFKPSAPGMAAPASAPPPSFTLPPAADPFALAAGLLGSDEMQDDNPDATRVAAVPQELIKAARQGLSGGTGENPSLKASSAGPAMPKVQSVIPPVATNDPEERHFQEVFRDFVATREKCGEAADGLTYEKFKTKLLKNKEQLVTKYQCRTVRFQVYVKEGKAALKATPVKD
jgi:hypothetical protein